MQALPVPALGGKIGELRKHVNLSDDAFVMAVGWMLSALRGRGPYPILALNGEQGAGKTTAADMLRQLHVRTEQGRSAASAALATGFLPRCIDHCGL